MVCGIWPLKREVADFQRSMFSRCISGDVCLKKIKNQTVMHCLLGAHGGGRNRIIYFSICSQVITAYIPTTIPRKDLVKVENTV